MANGNTLLKLYLKGPVNINLEHIFVSLENQNSMATLFLIEEPKENPKKDKLRNIKYSINIHLKHCSIIAVSDTCIPLCSELAGWRHTGTTEEKLRIKCYIIYIITTLSIKSRLIWFKSAQINNHIHELQHNILSALVITDDSLIKSTVILQLQTCKWLKKISKITDNQSRWL